MTTRKAPYNHADGSNCWTKDCSRRQTQLAEKELFFQQIKNKYSNVTHLSTNLPPLADFMTALQKKRLDCSRHPEFPYITFKYSRDTQFNYDWDEVTLAARGIIFNEETGEVVARPFAKFFNHNEPTAPTEQMVGPVEVTEKLDGSLGLGYVDENGKFNIATSGSFISEQAVRATELYHDRYEGKWNPKSNLTYMWEIIYPSNRVVVNYGDEDDIHLIGAVDKRTGRSIPLSKIKEWKWKRAEEHTLSSLDEVISAGERPNHEGFIIHYTDTDVRVKYKHSEYLEHHRTATGVTAKTIWKQMFAGTDMDEWKKDVPEEFLPFINTRQEKIQADYDKKVEELYAAHKSYKASLPEGYDRKTFAVTLNSSKDIPKSIKGFILNIETQGALRLNNVQQQSLWKSVKPQDDVAFWNL